MENDDLKEQSILIDMKNFVHKILPLLFSWATTIWIFINQFMMTFKNRDNLTIPQLFLGWAIFLMSFTYSFYISIEHKGVFKDDRRTTR